LFKKAVTVGSSLTNIRVCYYTARYSDYLLLKVIMIITKFLKGSN
jgi:hypothetical protein